MFFEDGIKDGTWSQDIDADSVYPSYFLLGNQTVISQCVALGLWQRSTLRTISASEREKQTIHGEKG